MSTVLKGIIHEAYGIKDKNDDVFSGSQDSSENLQLSVLNSLRVDL
jgi:hypothetical protein